MLASRAGGKVSAASSSDSEAEEDTFGDERGISRVSRRRSVATRCGLTITIFTLPTSRTSEKHVNEKTFVNLLGHGSLFCFAQNNETA